MTDFEWRQLNGYGGGRSTKEGLGEWQDDSNFESAEQSDRAVKMKVKEARWWEHMRGQDLGICLVVQAFSGEGKSGHVYCRFCHVTTACILEYSQPTSLLLSATCMSLAALED